MPRPRAILALVRRDALGVRSYKAAVVLDLALGALGLGVYYFISETFERIPAGDLQGARSYFAFAAVGVAVTFVIQTAGLGVFQRVRDEQLTGTLEMLTVQPLRTSELAMGLAGFPFMFAGARAAVYLLLANLLGADFSAADWPGFAAAFVASAVALMPIGVVVAAVALVVKRADALATLATFGLGFLGGAYFPRQVLPGWLETIARVIPTRFVFDGIRGALFRGEAWARPVLYLACFTAIALPVAVLAFDRALRLTQRRATLTQY
jgi:ABC-type multidrug transport system permease subunit